jgi:hypothetical protein
VAEDIGTYTSNGPAPMVTPDGSYQLTARRPGRELFPSSWLRHRARVMYGDGQDLCGVLLGWTDSPGERLQEPHRLGHAASSRVD